MNIFDRRREPLPIELPLPRREAASQITVVDRPGIARSSARCDCCGSLFEEGARFCGQCGMKRQQLGYTRLVSLSR
jgi:hypothetical protein